jgi:hypothetical protein
MIFVFLFAIIAITIVVKGKHLPFTTGSSSLASGPTSPAHNVRFCNNPAHSVRTGGRPAAEAQKIPDIQL